MTIIGSTTDHKLARTSRPLATDSPLVFQRNPLVRTLYAHYIRGGVYAHDDSGRRVSTTHPPVKHVRHTSPLTFLHLPPAGVSPDGDAV